MGVHAWWPLALLVLVPVIILLYFLKQKVKQEDFSSVMLWKEVYRTTEAASPWEKLRKNLLMILQIITVLLFILALMGPWLSSFGSEKVLTVLILDNSASMGTLYDGQQTRLDAAKENACDYVEHLADGSSIYIISGNQQAVLVLSNSQDKSEAKRAIRGIEQTTLPGDLSSSLGLVQSCAGQSEESQIIFLTDTVFDKGDLNARVENYCTDVQNCSLDQVSCSRKDGKLLVLVQATNYGTQELTEEVNLYGEDSQGQESLLEIGEIQMPAGETSSLYFELDKSIVTEDIRALRAELNEPDALAGDNVAWCVLEEEHTSRVLLLTRSNLFVEKAFDSLSGVDVYRTSDLGVFDTEDGSGYDLYIFDGMVPETLPISGNLFFLNCEYAPFSETSGQAESIRLELIESEVTFYTAGTSFGVNASKVYDVPVWGTAFLKAGDEAAGFYGTCDGRRIAVMGFDLHETDFGLQAEFPILISELSGYLLDTGLTEKVSYVAGESILVHGSSSGSELKVNSPDGSSETIPAGEVSGSYLEKQEPGIYLVSQEQMGQKKEQIFAVQFPVGSESKVESAQSMVSEEDSAKGTGLAGGLELRKWFLVLLLILMCLEWAAYVKMT